MATTIDRNPAHLFPLFLTKLTLTVNEMNRWMSIHMPGWSCALFEGFRSQARQEELYAQGRTAPGQIVTWTHHSDHTSCMAGDIIPRSPEGKWVFEGRTDEEESLFDAFWSYLNHVAHVNGLEQTQDYSARIDQPHVQWPQADQKWYVQARTWAISQHLI